MEIAAGLPTVICDVGVGRGGTWNDEGTILFNSVNDGPLLRVSATGGTPVPFTTVDTAHGENSHRSPQFLPGGRRFLYFVRTTNVEKSGVPPPMTVILNWQAELSTYLLSSPNLPIDR